MSSFFTVSQVKAYSYILSSVEKNLSASQALKFFRQGGGAIRTQDWYSLYKTVKQGYELHETLYTLTAKQIIPESWYIESPYKYHQKYNIVAEVLIYDKTNDTYYEKYVSLQSSRRLTLNTILDKIYKSVEIIKTTDPLLAGDEELEIKAIKDIKLFKRI